jgi:hypothetical protein
MNKYWKDKWLTALRSGEYKQTTECLRDDKGYCCLGVLSDLVAKEYPEQFKWNKFEELKVNKYQLTTTGNVESAVLMDEIVDITKVPDRYGKLEDEQYLTKYNDDGYTFEEIADLIEEHY